MIGTKRKFNAYVVDRRGRLVQGIGTVGEAVTHDGVHIMGETLDQAIDNGEGIAQLGIRSTDETSWYDLPKLDAALSSEGLHVGLHETGTVFKRSPIDPAKATNALSLSLR